MDQHLFKEAESIVHFSLLNDSPEGHGPCFEKQSPRHFSAIANNCSNSNKQKSFFNAIATISFPGNNRLPKPKSSESIYNSACQSMQCLLQWEVVRMVLGKGWVIVDMIVWIGAQRIFDLCTGTLPCRIGYMLEIGCCCTCYTSHSSSTVV